MRGDNKHFVKNRIKQQLRGLDFGEKVNTFIIGENVSLVVAQ